MKDIRQRPYMVSIMINKQHFCGGGLISLDFVVSACHCLAMVPENTTGLATPANYLKLPAYSFLVGSRNVINFEDHAQIGKAKSLHFHPQCQNNGSLVYDHALARLREPFRLTPYVKPLKMYSWDDEEFRRIFVEMFSSDKEPKCEVTGWGDTRKGVFEVNEASDMLKSLRMYVITENQCSEAWSDLLPSQFEGFNFWKYGEICTISDNNDASDCGGDSGSPFVCEGHHLIATVSYGTEDCGAGEPSVYATVAELLRWMKKDFPDFIKRMNSSGTEKDSSDPPYFSAESSTAIEAEGGNSSETPEREIPTWRKEAHKHSENKTSNRGSISQNAPPILTILLIICYNQ